MIKNRRREPGRDVKILSDRMLRIKGSTKHSSWTCVDRPSCSVDEKLHNNAPHRKYLRKRRLPASACLFSLESGVALSRTVLRTTPVVVVVVVVDSHIQRIVLATEETTVTQQVSHRPIKCQSRLWSQRGTKVNGSHHGDNPLLRPTGIQIATKSYASLQAMAPTNIKTVHQTSLLHIESNLDRLGMLSPTHDQRSQQKHGKITEQLRSNQF